MKKSFQLSAIAIAISLTSAVYADTNISDIDNVNVIVDNNDGGIGAFNVIKGVTSPTTLITSDVNSSGGTIINTNTTINGNLAVNGGTSTILTAAPVATSAGLVIPTVNPAFSNTTQTFSQNRVDTQDQTRSVDAQVIDQNKFQLNTSEQTGQQSWTTSQTASAQYDANGVIIPGSLTGPVLGATVDNGFVASSVNKVQDLTLGRNNTSEDYRLSITKTDNGVTNTTNVAATGITTSRITGNGTNGSLVLSGGTGTTTQTLNDNGVSFVTTQPGTGIVTATTTIDANGNLVVKGRDVLANIDDEAATRAAADTAIRSEAATEKTRVNGELAAATTDRAAIRTEFAAADTAIRSEAATEKTRVNGEFTRVDAAAAAETTRVNTAISAGDAATLTSANAYTNVRANQLNSRVDDVERTAYRGIAIALAAQQQVPNIKPGQFAVFGGVGHYESESAVALGVVGALNDRLSMSAALGFADGSEIGGRVGLAYVFGGN